MGKKLFELLDSVVEEIGEKNVLQIVTYNWSNYVSAGKKSMHKAPFIEELEEQMQKLHEERANAIVERNTADNDDKIYETELAIAAAQAELRKGRQEAVQIK